MKMPKEIGRATVCLSAQRPAATRERLVRSTSLLAAAAYFTCDVTLLWKIHNLSGWLISLSCELLITPPSCLIATRCHVSLRL
jgi:hypothetical protein